MAVIAADIRCTGQVTDEQGEPVIGATVSVAGTQQATATDIDGKFTINAPQGKAIKIAFIGYKTVEQPARANMGVIKLDTESTMLQDVIVTQSIARTRETPVAMSTVDAATIDVKLGGQEFPEVLKTTPGVYTIRQGGGFGDAETRMRGFKSPNVATMVNGIPVNDMEWGGVYWSNWAGLSDVASNIQTQRGLGASIISTPSVGGTLNITTRTIDVEKGGSLWYGMGNDNMNVYGFKASTGLMKNGWAVTLLGSRKWGDGYIQGTSYNSYNYFLNVSKRINEFHQLSLTAFGAPQEHNQRSSYDGLSIEGWQQVKNYMDGKSMYRYNPTFGYDRHGKAMTGANHNVYHKPQISLNHMWKIDDSSTLSSAVYVSIGSGYGMRGMYRSSAYSSGWYGADSSNGKLNTTFRCPDGTFDYAAVQEMNAASQTGSNMALARNKNAHEWYGLVSNYKKEINRHNGDRLNITAGVDFRYYIGHHKAVLDNLMDGAYFIDDYNRSRVLATNNSAAKDPQWQLQKLGVGDVVYRNYNGYTVQEGIYAQAEYTMLDKKLNLVLAGSLNNTDYWRRDFFYYDKDNERSETVNFFGGTIKGGANYNIDRHNNVFLNAGYISRAPFFQSGVFASYNTSNIVNKKAINEKVISIEGGYGYQSHQFALTGNVYYTRWIDRTMAKTGSASRGAAEDRYFFNMSGVGARHMGLEVNFTYIPVQWMTIEGMLSWGDWEWDSNATGYFYNQNGQPLANINTGAIASGIYAPDHVSATLNQKGIKVGGSAQTTANLGVTFKPFKGFRIGADWTVAARNYSDLNITSSTLSDNSEINVKDPWCIPWGSTIDLNCSYRFKMGGFNATLYGNVHNLANYNYITQAYTPVGSQGSWENAYQVFYSFGRTYSLKLRLNF